MNCLANEMLSKRCRLITIVFLLVVLCATLPCLGAPADGFVSKRVRFDGKDSKGKLDKDNYLSFSAWSKWGAPIVVRFSPVVRSQFSLVPFVETEANGVLGAYTVTLSFSPKTRRVTYRNLTIQTLDDKANEIPSDGMVSQSGNGWVIGLATEQKPSYIHISYSSEKKLHLTPADSQHGSDI